MFCPECEAEFVRGVELCSDCHVPLVEALAPQPTCGDPDEGEPAEPAGPLVRVPIENASDSALVQSLLRRAGFPFRVQPGFGEMWNEVYVRETDVPAIRDYLDDYRSQRGFDPERLPLRW